MSDIFVGTINRIIQIPYLHKQHPLCLVGEDFALILAAGEFRNVVVLIQKSYIHICCHNMVGWFRLPRFNLYDGQENNASGCNQACL